MIFIKRYDTGPEVVATLVDGAGDAVDLTGASVNFIVKGAGDPQVNSAASVFDAIGGRVRYDWAVADTANAGQYEGEFEVTFSDGTIETFPRDGYIGVNIYERFGGSGALIGLMRDSADELLQNVTAAFGTSSSDPYLDLTGDGLVTALDLSAATLALASANNLLSGNAATIAAFDDAPAAIKAILDAGNGATATPAQLVNSTRFMFDIDGDGAITETDLIYARDIAGHE